MPVTNWFKFLSIFSTTKRLTYPNVEAEGSGRKDFVINPAKRHAILFFHGNFEMKYWICVTLNFAFSIWTGKEKYIHYLLCIQLSDYWFMIRLDLNISCRHWSFNAWTTVTGHWRWALFISACLMDILISLRYRMFDETITLMHIFREDTHDRKAWD